MRAGGSTPRALTGSTLGSARSSSAVRPTASIGSSYRTARTTRRPTQTATCQTPGRLPRRRAARSTTTLVDLAPENAYSGTHFAWGDWSDCANNFTASGIDRPTLVPNWLDGNNGVRFDGVTQYLWRSVFRGMGTGTKPCVLMVCHVDATQPEPAPTLVYFAGWEGAPSFRSPFAIEHTASTAKVYTHLSPSITDTRAQGLAGTADPHWVLAKAGNSADKPEVWVNGALKGVAASGVAGGIFQTVIESTIGGGTVGSDPANRWFKGTIGRIIIFAGEPTTGEFNALFAGLLRPEWPSLPWVFV